MSEPVSVNLNQSDFERSLQSAFPLIYQRLTNRFHDPQLAEEVSWDCLTHAYEVWRTDPHFFDQRDLTSWSSQRASWRALDRLRERSRFTSLIESHSGEDEAGTSPLLPAFDPHEANLRLRDREIAWECIGELDAEDQFILVGHFYEGRSDQELGTELYGEEGTAQARGLRIWRRRQKAQARLEDLIRSRGIDPADYNPALAL